MQLIPVDGMRLPSMGIAAITDVRKVTSPSPSSQQTVAVNFSPMPDGEVVRIATPEEVRSRMTARGHVVNNPAEAYRRFATDDRRLSNVPPPSSRPAPQPVPPPQPSSPSHFSLLEVDTDIKDTKAPTPQAPKPSTGLAALQQELRAEREAKRALAATQTPLGRFDLLECDEPAVATAAPMPRRPVVSSSPSKPSLRRICQAKG